MSDYLKEFIITWKIENFSFSWHKRDEPIESPEFFVEIFGYTEWKLSVYPRGNYKSGYIACFLQRNGYGPEEIMLNFEISFLGTEGTALAVKASNTFSFSKHGSKIYYDFVKQDEVFAVKRAEFLPEDVLTVRCRLWTNDTCAFESKEWFARTRIEVVRRLISGTVDVFNSLTTNERGSVNISSASEDVRKYRMKLQLTDGTNCDENLMLQIIFPENQRKKFSTCKVYLIDAAKNKLECGKSSINFEQKKNWKFRLSPTKWKLMAKKSLYLCNDVLSLECEIIISTGVSSEEIERQGDRISAELNPVSNFERFRDPSVSSSALEDLGKLYRDQVLCDVTLKTDTESFPAHTVILSARSSVFRAMFTSDMKEKRNACVNISDFDSETVRQLLLYAYTDTVEDLEWHKALKLYAAADKYAIMSLKEKCNAFLKESLCTSKSCEILVLADTHQDMDLKKFIQNYIYQNDDQIFGSEQWKDLERKYPQLFLETLSQMYANARAF